MRCAIISSAILRGAFFNGQGELAHFCIGRLLNGDCLGLDLVLLAEHGEETLTQDLLLF
jgi:hypothetical protein